MTAQSLASLGAHGGTTRPPETHFSVSSCGPHVPRDAGTILRSLTQRFPHPRLTMPLRPDATIPSLGGPRWQGACQPAASAEVGTAQDDLSDPTEMALTWLSPSLHLPIDASQGGRASAVMWLCTSTCPRCLYITRLLIRHPGCLFQCFHLVKIGRMFSS